MIDSETTDDEEDDGRVDGGADDEEDDGGTDGADDNGGGSEDEEDVAASTVIEAVQRVPLVPVARAARAASRPDALGAVPFRLQLVPLKAALPSRNCASASSAASTSLEKSAGSPEAIAMLLLATVPARASARSITAWLGA